MKASRSGPVLLIGFGLLIGIIVVSGVSAIQRAHATYRDISALNERYRQTDRNLNEIASGIYTMGLLARDYLLDPSTAQAPEYRTRLIAQRNAMDAEFSALQSVIRAEDRPRLDRLQKDVQGYWDALDPLFQWTAEEKAARNWRFLRREILPHRRAALVTAQEISNLTQANLDRQRLEIDRNEEAMARFTGRMLAFALVLGFAIAGITVFRMTKLEKDADRQRQRTEAAEQELRLLSRQLLQASENERKSISRELHDEVGQMLTALRIELRSLQDLRTAPEPEFDEHLEDAKRLAEQSLRAVRDMAMGLRPSMLDDLGLGSAIQWQARQFSKHTGIPVNVRIDNVPAALPDAHRTCIYRFVQETLTNCARHARAKMIDIDLRAENGNLAVSVHDDGVGFDASQIRGRGLGLIGLQERVKELDGEITLSSKLAGGTLIAATIPIRSEAISYEHAHSAS